MSTTHHQPPLSDAERWERNARYRLADSAAMLAELALRIRDAPTEARALDVQRLASVHRALDLSWVQWRTLRTQLTRLRAEVSDPAGGPR